MGKSKKYTRNIIVDGVAYRWKISKSNSDKYDYRVSTIQFIVFTNEGNNQLLSCSVPKAPLLVITPKFVRSCIEEALQLGWRLQSKGESFSYKFSKLLPNIQSH